MKKGIFFLSQLLVYPQKSAYDVIDAPYVFN